MISTLELIFNLDTKINRLANLKGQYIPVETKIEVLNLSQTKLVLKKLGYDNNYQAGTDSFDKRYVDLQTFQVPFEKLPLTAYTGNTLDIWTAKLSSLSKTLLIPANMYALADRGSCKGRIIDIITVAKHNDVRLLLRSPHYKPSFNYQETIASISGDDIFIYGDSSFTMSDLYISYLRYPVAMDVVGYTKLDNTPSANVDCELEAYLQNELLDLAVEEIADATGNREQSELSRLRTKENE